MLLTTLWNNYPLVAKSVDTSFYVNDGLTGADSIPDAIELQQQLQNLFSTGGFLLRKWNSSEQAIQHLPADLKDPKSIQEMPSTEEYTKTQWNAPKDCYTHRNSDEASVVLSQYF